MPEYFKKSLDLISSGKVDVEKLITKRFSLDQVEEALKMQANSEVIKAAIIP